MRRDLIFLADIPSMRINAIFSPRYCWYSILPFYHYCISRRCRLVEGNIRWKNSTRLASKIDSFLPINISLRGINYQCYYSYLRMGLRNDRDYIRNARLEKNIFNEGNRNELRRTDAFVLLSSHDDSRRGNETIRNQNSDRVQ